MKKLALVVVSVALLGIISLNLNGQTLGTGQSQRMPTLLLTEAAVPSGSANTGVLFAGSVDHLFGWISNNGTAVNGPVSYFLTGSAYTNATTGFTSVTGLAFPVSASRNYAANCKVLWQGSAGTTGPKYQFTGPASPTAVAAGMNSIVTATTVITASAVAFSSAMANSGTVTTATNFLDSVTISVLNGVNAGTVQLQAAANGAGTLTIQPGSYCLVQ